MLFRSGLATRSDQLRATRGTLAYWPPEGPRDQTADLYAVGKTLYLLLTGADLEPWHRPDGPLVLPGSYQVRLEAGDAADAPARFVEE